MKYCDYTFYKNSYSGVMPETIFNRLSVVASSEINKYTFGRIDVKKTILDEIKYCTCELTDYIKKIEKQEGKKSESVGTWNVSYAESEQIQNKIYDIVKKYLSYIKAEDGTPLLYRGC